MSATLIPFSPETVLVPRPTFESIADDLGAYQETLAMIEAEIATEKDDSARDAAIDERVDCLRNIERLHGELMQKADDLAHVFRRLERDLKEQTADAKRITARAKVTKETLDRLKAYTQTTMEKRGWKHLKTALNTIAIKKNGGIEPLVISQPELIPDELCTWRGELSDGLYKLIIETLRYYGKWVIPDLADLHAKFTRVPSPALVREALIQPCATCDGSGIFDVEFQCQDCGGTGRASVPGAHLAERGAHVEVR